VAEHVYRAFEKAGLPSGVLQYFHCGVPTNMEVLIRDPRIEHICFTGSVPGGLSVQKAAADRIVTVGLELGGNDPAYVRSDVDAKWAAEEIVDGAIFNSGQSCCSIERVYVHEDIYDKFVDAVQHVLEGYRLGDPSDKDTQIGPVISKAAQARIERQIKDAIARGASDMTPSNPTFSNTENFPGGSFVKPTLLVGVDSSMEVMQEETFGPVIPVMKVRSDKEAVKLMNDSEFGLTASIWSKDEARALELAEQVEAGTVFVNRCDFPSPDLAWTGWKNSGKGVTLSKFGFDQFVKLKSYHLKDYPK
jgi:acyl-CoA reductase-like NAD-dependent aldehyde dehydrogenase